VCTASPAAAQNGIEAETPAKILSPVEENDAFRHQNTFSKYRKCASSRKTTFYI
jgi:hypothetical protein